MKDCNMDRREPKRGYVYTFPITHKLDRPSLCRYIPDEAESYYQKRAKKEDARNRVARDMRLATGQTEVDTPYTLRFDRTHDSYTGLRSEKRRRACRIERGDARDGRIVARAR